MGGGRVSSRERYEKGRSGREGLTKHLDEPLCRLEELEGVDAVGGDGDVVEGLRREELRVNGSGTKEVGVVLYLGNGLKVGRHSLEVLGGRGSKRKAKDGEERVQVRVEKSETQLDLASQDTA